MSYLFTEKKVKPAGSHNLHAASLARLIGYADRLLSAGCVDIYDMSYEVLENSLYMWEYRALDGRYQ